MVRGKQLAARFLALAATAWFTCAAGYGADETVVIKKKRGGLIEGVIVRQNNIFIEVKTKYGKLKVSREDILSITKGVSPLTRFKQRWQAIKGADAQALIQLGEWCEGKELWPEADKSYASAMQIAGPHYIAAVMHRGKLALALEDHRLAVESYLALVKRFKHEGAWQALQDAETSLYEARMKYWESGRKAQEAGQFLKAVKAYRETLGRMVRADADIVSGPTRAAIYKELLYCRIKHLDSLRTRYPESDLVETDPRGSSWKYLPLPENLRRDTRAITLKNLRVDLEMFGGRWLALSGVYHGLSRWNGADALAIRLAPEKHLELAVAAYSTDAKAHYRKLRTKRSTRYLKELLKHYPFGKTTGDLKALTTGQKIVCHGRLRRRKKRLPQYIFEIWAVDTVNDTDALDLADYLKQPLRCEFTKTPLASVLEFVNMVTRVEVEFEAGKIPEISISLPYISGSAGYVIDQLAAQCGLQWTRRGKKVLMKKKLTEKEAALKAQVLRLATDKAKR